MEFQDYYEKKYLLETRLHAKLDELFSQISFSLAYGFSSNPYTKLMGLDRIKGNLDALLPSVELLEKEIDELTKQYEGEKEHGSKIEEN